MQYREGIEVTEESLLERRNKWRFEELRNLFYCYCNECVDYKLEHLELEEEFLNLKAIEDEAREEREEEFLNLEAIKDEVREIVEEESKLPIGNIRVSEDKLYGFFIEVEIFGAMREALEEWLRLIDVFKALGINTPIYPKILGEFNVLPGEFGRLIGLGLSKMKVPLRGEKLINVTEIISRERGE